MRTESVLTDAAVSACQDKTFVFLIKTMHVLAWILLGVTCVGVAAGLISFVVFAFFTLAH